MNFTLTTTETASGHSFDLADPKTEDIKFVDIAWALSRQARYAGHTSGNITYTVAQHTVLVSNYVEQALTPDTQLNEMLRTYIWENGQRFANSPGWRFLTKGEYSAKQIAFHGLMHDFAEAYLTDLPTPVKRLPGVYEAYKAHELRLDALIYMTYGLGYGPRGIDSLGDIVNQELWDFSLKVVGWADLLALRVEAYHLMQSRGKTWSTYQEVPMEILNDWPVPVDGLASRLLLIERFNELRVDKVLNGW